MVAWADRLHQAVLSEIVRGVAVRGWRHSDSAPDALRVLRLLAGASHCALFVRDGDHFRVLAQDGALPHGVDISDLLPVAATDWPLPEAHDDDVVVVPSRAFLVRRGGSNPELDLMDRAGVERGFVIRVGGIEQHGILTVGWSTPAGDDWQPEWLHEWRVVAELIVGLNRARRAQDRSLEAAHSWAALYAGLAESILLFRASDGVIIEMNLAAQELLGKHQGKVRVGDTLLDRRHQRYEPETFRQLAPEEHPAVRVAMGLVDVEQRIVARQAADGSMRNSVMYASAFDVDGVRHVLLVGRDVDDDVASTPFAESMITDPVTGLDTGLMLERRFDWVRQVAEYHGVPVRVAMIDLDGLQRVGEQRSLQVVSEVVTALTERIVTAAGLLAAVCRYSPALMTVISPAMSTEGEHVEALLDVFLKPFETSDGPVRLISTVGVCTATDGEGRDVLFSRAGTALVDAKRSQQPWKGWTPKDRDTGFRRVTVEDVQAAFEKSEFEPRLWPIVQTRTNEIVGAESLLWWNHPLRGGLNPDGWRSDALSLGFAEKIFATEVRFACRALASLPDSHRVLVRIEREITFNETHVDFVREALGLFNVPGSRLVLSVGVIEATPSVRACLVEAQKFGVQVALTIPAKAGDHTFEYLTETEPAMLIFEHPLYWRPDNLAVGLAYDIAIGLGARSGTPVLLREFEGLVSPDVLYRRGVSLAQSWKYHTAVGLDDYLAAIGN